MIEEIYKLVNLTGTLRVVRFAIARLEQPEGESRQDAPEGEPDSSHYRPRASS